MNLIVRVYNNQYNFEVETLDKLLELIESEINVDRSFFYLNYQDTILNYNFEIKNLINNSLIDLYWKFKYFNSDLKSLSVEDKNYQIPVPILLESIVVNTILCNDNEDYMNILNDDNQLIFNTKEILNKDSITDWLNLSCEIKSFLENQNKTLDDLKIPKPLINKKLYYYVGNKAYQYLDSMNFKKLKNLATLSDFLDIPYLLETTSAFIAEKHVKNNSVENIKKIFDNIEV